MPQAKQKNFSLSDQAIIKFDRLLRTLGGGATQAKRANPANTAPTASLNAQEKQHIAGLMRINHTGEVCAQALYQGQALTAKSTQVKTAMQSSAEEEEDHLAWCEQRLIELGSQPSYLNPVFYSLSFTLGAAAGIAGDKWSLGFVEATEDQVCKHLSDHLEQIPEQDQKTRVNFSNANA